MLPNLQNLLLSENPTIPLIVDESTALECVSIFSSSHTVSFEECKSGMLPSVYLFEKEDEKQSLSIKQIRDAISILYEKPYEGKVLLIFRDFDSASMEAMNASLKLLEEPPEYAIILLTVTNPENVIETVRSRTLTFFVENSRIYLDAEYLSAIENYHNQNIAPLIRLISKQKIEKESAIGILRELGNSKNAPPGEVLEKAIIDIMTVNESTKNILDRVILCSQGKKHS